MLPSVRSLTNSYSSVNPLFMSSVFTSVLPGISLSSSEAARRPPLSALTPYMYAVSDLNSTNGYLITVLDSRTLISNLGLQSMFLGICPLLIFG